MFEFLFRILPSSVFPALAGATLWAGASYFYLAPEVYQRATNAMVSDFRDQILEFAKFHSLTLSHEDAQAYARCVYDETAKDEDFRLDFAVWVSTVGHYGRPRLKDMKPILDQVIENKRCGEQPWIVAR